MKRAVPLLAVAVTLGLAPGAMAGSDGPLDDVRTALAKASFSGRMVVSWRDGGALRRTSLMVRAKTGELAFDGPVPIVKTFGSHFVRLSSGWSDLAPGKEVAQPTTDKYTVRRDVGPVVAGRGTDLLEILDRGQLRERMALDHQLGVVLRREQFDDGGRLVRRVEFASFDATTPTAPRGRPQRYRSEQASTMGAAVPAPFRAPASLAGGYRRVGVYVRDAVVHVVYGDGMYGLSVFEQPGHLNWRELPTGGETVSVGGHRARSYVWPGGGLVTWQAGGSTFTVVGDGLPADVLAAAASLPRGRSLSTAQRLRQTARELVETLSGG